MMRGSLKRCCSRSRRNVTLLEVLIAFALIALCAAPLLAPHAQMIFSQQRFEKRVERDFMINNHFGELLVALYRNEIAWKEIEKGTSFPIEGGSYKFEILKPEPSEEAAAYLVGVIYMFEEGEYRYELFLSRGEEEA